MKSIFFYATSIGEIGIADNGEAITHLLFKSEAGQQGGVVKQTALIKEAAAQIKEYLAGQRKTFKIPVAVEGTKFQQKVWKALENIPYGETRSYREIAESIGQPKAFRAVGMANHKNPLAILTPCHRVIGSNGKLVGYAGGLDIKEKLLDMEKQYANN